MTALSVAMVGAGNMAGGFDEHKLDGDGGVYSHAGAYAAAGTFSLKTVFDTDCGRAAAFRDRWKVAQVAASISDIYAGFHDVVSVCAPDDAHGDIVRALLESRSCRTIFVEKPAATSAGEIAKLEQLARDAGIHVVVNFQRRNEAAHQAIRDRIAATRDGVLAASAYYVKGLQHIGITAIDTLTFLLGYPRAVLAYNRVLNQQTSGYSYDFVLFYDGFNVSVRTTDSERFGYTYHIFEIDLLLVDGRVTLLDNGRTVRELSLGPYAYSGVHVLNDRAPRHTDTEFPLAMVSAVRYVHDVTAGAVQHTTNTLASSYNNAVVVERVIESHAQSYTLDFDTTQWKK
jgi:predicted dehydrogenase